MKLKKYENKELRKSKIISFVLACICLIFIGTTIYQSYANYQMKATFKIINGKLKIAGGSGDIEFAFYNGDQKIDTMPVKNNEEGLVFIKAECTNDAVIEWSNKNWNVTISNLTKTKTSCSLYFGSKTEKICTLAGEESGSCYLAKKSDNDKTNFAYDDTDDANLRYISATPNNYVYFNCQDGVEANDETCETWRIIGVMNNITEVSEDGKNKETNGTHIKIIRDIFENYYSWDSSDAYTNSGNGVNEWSDADIEKVLNDEYLYRRTGTNKCYESTADSTKPCPDWANIGIMDEARSMIENIKWNTGTMASYIPGLTTTKYMYEAERSSHNGKELCSANGSTYCNDKVNRTTTWTGKVGLMYPSDYGYAVGGDVRDVCLKKSMNNYNSDSCATNDWLTSVHQWTMTPVPTLSSAYTVFCIYSSGSVTSCIASNDQAIRPTLYLKSNVKIKSNDDPTYGSVGNPFVLET